MAHFLTTKLLTPLTVAAGISLLSGMAAHAEVTLQVDDNIKVTAINGQAVNTSLFQPIKKTFNLTPGQQVITARYDRLYDLPGDNHDYLKSSNVTVTAPMQDNQTYRLTMPGQPERYNEARDYAKHPTLAVVAGQQVVTQATTTQSDSGLFSGLGSIFGGNDAKAQNNQAIAAIQAQPAVTTSQASNQVGYAQSGAIPVSAGQTTAVSTLDNFMQLWLQATPAEREKIRQWVQQ